VRDAGLENHHICGMHAREPDRDKGVRMICTYIPKQYESTTIVLEKTSASWGAVKNVSFGAEKPKAMGENKLVF
jgi:hypothetical protein